MKLISCPNKFEKCTECDLNDETLGMIADTIKEGGLVVYPTDTLYALGADPSSEKAIALLFSIKARPMDMPVSVAVGRPEAIKGLAVLDERSKEMVQHHLPGPTTILVPLRRDAKLRPEVTKDGKIGIRMPDHPFAVRLTDVCGPVTATSANRHGGQEPKEVKTAIEELGPAVNIYVDCGECEIGRPSGIIDLTGEQAEEVRPGPISKEKFTNE